jgi:hypothetical protein
MSTYLGAEIDALQGADGLWHAYVGHVEVVSKKPLATIDDALTAAMAYVDEALDEQLMRRLRTEHLFAGIADGAPKRGPVLRVINCERDRLGVVAMAAGE